MQEVTLQQMLEAREERAWRQQALLREFQKPLVCFTMNIPGPLKDTPLIRRGFSWGCRELERRLTGICHREILWKDTGCEAFYVAEGEPLQMKAQCTAIEDQNPLGRLFDMDVLDRQGNKLDRALVQGKSRDCLVCGTPGRGCASRRLHSVSQLQSAVNRLLEEHFAAADRELVGQLAVKSLLQELATTPKPGLVDCRNNGSHPDMTPALFRASAEALSPYFRRCVEIGQTSRDAAPEETFARLREAGLAAETAMYRATGGINTHKGAVFTMGLLCGSLGRLWKPETPIAGTEAVLAECARLAVFAGKDFEGQPLTAGQRLHRERGLTGIRGEAASGLPSVAEIGLPIYRACREEGRSENEAGVITLLHLICAVEDTTLYHRGGAEGVAWAREQIRPLLPRPTLAAAEELDDGFIRRNLTAGGCADLLAATCFLYALEEEQWI